MDHGQHSSVDYLVALFAIEISKIIGNRISSEIDVSLSFNIDETIEKSREIIEINELLGVSRERVLIKIPSTMEGIHGEKNWRKKEFIVIKHYYFLFYMKLLFRS